MPSHKTAMLDDDALFSSTPQPVAGVPQRGLAIVPAEQPEPFVDLNFKVRPAMRRRVKDLAYKLDVKQVEILRRALDALERELAN